MKEIETFQLSLLLCLQPIALFLLLFPYVMKYLGITHFVPNFLQRIDIIHWFWRKVMCSRHIHLLDECKTLDDHYLVCDACQLTVHIESFDFEYVDGKLLQTWKKRSEQ